MALERNKTAFQFEPGIDPEFERMLRRHLKRGGSMVAACSGFDADLASAFLEHSLPEPARSQYQLHLAGCAACRRHLIELSRLFDSTEAIPAFVAEKQPAIPALSWKEKLAGWLDVSRWQAPAWNLQTAGLATAAIVFVAVSGVAIHQFRQDRQAHAPYQDLAVTPTAPSSGAGGSAEVQSEVDPRIVDGTSEASRLELREKSLSQGQMNQAAADKLQPAPVMPAPVPVPTLRATPPVNDNLLTADQPVSLRSSTTVTLPVTAGFAPAPPAPTIGNLAAQSRSMIAGESAESNRKPEPERAGAVQDAPSASVVSANMVVPQVGPSPDDNPMRGDKAAESEPAARKAAKLSSRRERIIAGALSFLPTRKEEAEAKPQPIKDSESIMRLKVRIHDRVFEYHSDKNMWIDQNYEPGMAWRVIRLVRGSEEYNQVLKEQPELKDFFVKDSILVIWKQKIYKVVPK